MKYFRLIGLLALCLAPALISNAQNRRDAWDQPYVNGIVAIVNDQIITRDELLREIAPLVPQIQRESRNAQQFEQKLSELSVGVLETLIDRILILEDFEKSGYIIPQSYLDGEFEDHITREFNGNRAQFLTFLQAHGMTVREFRKDQRDRIIVNFMRGRMRKSQSEVSPEKIAEYYRQNEASFFQEEAIRLRQIVLAPSQDQSAQQALADQIIAELNQGADFAELARKHSQDEKRSVGGDWGWINRSGIRQELAEAVFALPVGQHTQPIALDGYLFILKSEEKKQAGVKPLREVREQIERAITDQLARQAQDEWLARLRRDAYIKYYLQEAITAQGR